MKKLPYLLIALLFSSSLLAKAPGKLNGTEVALLVTSGTGELATFGSSSITFAQSSNTYTLTPSSNNINDSTGTFTYTASENTASMAMDDSDVGLLNVTLNFNSDTSGTYSASGNLGTQTGTFTITNVTAAEWTAQWSYTAQFPYIYSPEGGWIYLFIGEGELWAYSYRQDKWSQWQ